MWDGFGVLRNERFVDSVGEDVFWFKRSVNVIVPSDLLQPCKRARIGKKECRSWLLWLPWHRLQKINFSLCCFVLLGLGCSGGPLLTFPCACAPTWYARRSHAHCTCWEKKTPLPIVGNATLRQRGVSILSDRWYSWWQSQTDQAAYHFNCREIKGRIPLQFLLNDW